MEQPQAQPPPAPAQKSQSQQPRPKASAGLARAQRGFSAGSAAAACAWLNVQNRDSLELRGLPPEDLVDNTSGVSVIPTGSGIALISGSLLCVHDGTLMLD